MKVLTCYNQDLQRYNYKLTKDSFSKVVKNEWLDKLKEWVHSTGRSFNKVFPNKRGKIVDEIYYLLSASGINTIHTKTLMKKFDIKSPTTIRTTVKDLKESGQVLVCQLANGHAGTYAFVLKSHPNFKEIMKRVFYIDSLEQEEQEENEAPETIEAPENNNNENTNEHLIEHPFVHLQNPEPVEAVGLEGGKTDSISLISLSLKQELNNIKQSIENESLESSQLNQEEYLNTYAVNEYQLKMYHHIKAENFHDEIKNNAVILGLRVGSNCNYRGFVVAKNVVKLLNRCIENGIEITESIPAWFSSRYSKELLEMQQHQQQKQHQPPQNIKEILSYNYLES